MALGIILTLFASFLWGVTNHIDKFMLDGVDKNVASVKTLLLFSTLVAGFVFSPIWLFICKFSISISQISLIATLFSAFSYILATVFYYKALDKSDASIVVIMFQMIPVFTYIAALLLFDEHLTKQQLIGSIIIILSAAIISFDFEKRNQHNKLKALFFMILSSLFYSAYFILLDCAIRDSSYNACAFWLQIGFLIMGIFLFSLKSFRTPFLDAIKNNGKTYFSLNILNEILNLLAILAINYANVLIPIALVNVFNGFQGAFVFILGVLGVKLFPKYFQEDLALFTIIQKVGCIILGILGVVVMFL